MLLFATVESFWLTVNATLEALIFRPLFSFNFFRRPGNIIEWFGEAGCGKTQVFLDLALHTLAHSVSGHVVYLNTGTLKIVFT